LLRPWSVRLKALLPEWMPGIRKRFRLRAEIAKQLLKISPRQMDRRLKAQKTQRRRRLYGRTKPGYLLKHHIPEKTDRWDVQTPGFTEVDLVSHSGHSASGEFASAQSYSLDFRWIGCAKPIERARIDPTSKREARFPDGEANVASR